MYRVHSAQFTVLSKGGFSTYLRKSGNYILLSQDDDLFLVNIYIKVTLPDNINEPKKACKSTCFFSITI